MWKQFGRGQMLFHSDSSPMLKARSKKSIDEPFCNRRTSLAFMEFWPKSLDSSGTLKYSDHNVVYFIPKNTNWFVLPSLISSSHPLFCPTSIALYESFLTPLPLSSFPCVPYEFLSCILPPSRPSVLSFSPLILPFFFQSLCSSLTFIPSLSHCYCRPTVSPRDFHCRRRWYLAGDSKASSSAWNSVKWAQLGIHG